jgi:hypothetical protein
MTAKRKRLSRAKTQPGTAYGQESFREACYEVAVGRRRLSCYVAWGKGPRHMPVAVVMHMPFVLVVRLLAEGQIMRSDRREP